MKPAASQLEETLNGIQISEPHSPVVANYTAMPVALNEIKASLVHQLYSPVRWQQSIEFMIGEGAQTYLWNLDLEQSYLVSSRRLTVKFGHTQLKI